MTDRTASADLLTAAESILPDVVDVRRRLHRHPEVGLDLPVTQAIVGETLAGLGLTPRFGRTVSSVTARVDGPRPGPTVLLRADMDGLPLHEDSGLPFASEVDGTMHACGHDTHVAMLLGAARLLAERRDDLAGSVLLMFQPGEEGYHGARLMIEEGLLDEPGAAPVTGAFALHISTRYPTGTINVRPGALLASSDTLRITVRGRGGHASAPHLAVDPIAVAARVLIDLQTMVTRQVDVFDPAVITIAQVVAGTTTNIIPETAFLGGTIRTVSAATRAAIHERIRAVAAGAALATGAAVDVEIEPGYPVTVNDPGFTAFAAATAVELLGDSQVRELAAPIMGAEDFSYVLERIPGAMAFLGASPAGIDPESGPQNHSNLVVFDEAAMAVGVAALATVALRHLAS